MMIADENITIEGKAGMEIAWITQALEDLLEMLIHDLGVDHADDALKVLEEQRVR